MRGNMLGHHKTQFTLLPPSMERSAKWGSQRTTKGCKPQQSAWLENPTLCYLGDKEVSRDGGGSLKHQGEQ